MKHLPSIVNIGTALRVLTLLTISLAPLVQSRAQTPGGTVISNQASATYSDGTNSYSTVSNTVTVIVSNVSGLTITPDGGANPTVVAGQTGVFYSFTVTNSGNFPNQVRFLAAGASVSLVGPGTVTRAVIDVAPLGSIDGSDIDIKTNGADVLSASIAQNGSISVLVEVTVNPGATASQIVQVLLGDASTGGPSFDNQPANTSANEVRTVSAGSVNGLREARGDVSSTVVDDAQLRLTLVAPPGPVPLGSVITYAWQVCNPSARDATGVVLSGAPQVYIVAPIPARTVLTSGQTFPVGTLYTTSLLTIAPLSATWSLTAPVPLANTTRIAFPVGATLASGNTCSASINMNVTINTGIDASIPIDEIGDTFAKNSVNATITDQSGDTTVNNGDGNANFNEGYVPGAGHGVIQQTLLAQLGSVLIGPNGAPAAVGPTNNNDDYTNMSVNVGIAGVAFGGVTTVVGQIIFVNTVLNSGNTSDTYTINAPTVPAGFTVEISTAGIGGPYTLVSGGGSVPLALAFGASANIHVRVTAPAGNTVLTGFGSVIRATSNTTPAAFNETIDRLYTGFVRLDKLQVVNNATGVGGLNEAVPGAVITYNITYTNISSSGGTGNVQLTATNVVITENGSAAPNNWGTFTTHTGTPSDSGSGSVVIVNAFTYTDTIASLAPGASGVFSFQRLIN